MKMMMMMKSTRSLGLLLLVALVFGGCGGKAKSAEDWAAPDVAEGKGVSFGPTSDGKEAAPGAVTAYDDTPAGLHIEMPCATGQKKTTDETYQGAIRAKVVRMTCTVKGTQYMLEYWQSAELIDESKIRAAAEAIGKASIEPEAGWELKQKTMIDQPLGWTNVEVRSMKGGKLRVERTHVLLPRHVMLRTTSSEADALLAEPFLNSLKMREEGAPFGAAKDTGVVAMRSIELPPGKLSLLLPCAPKVDPVARDDFGNSMTAQSTLFSCRHPSANILYAGMFRRFDRPGDGSPAEMKQINQGLAKQLAAEVCASMGLAGCKPGPVTLSKGNAFEARVTTTMHATARVIADYPSLAFVLITAPRGAEALQKDTPETLKQAELERDRASLQDETRTFASITLTAR